MYVNQLIIEYDDTITSDKQQPRESITLMRKADTNDLMMIR